MTDIDTMPPAKPTGLDALKGLPMEQRLIYLLQTLDKLQKSNLARKHPVELTRRQADENKYREGAVKAYNDTSKFITTIFGEELRAVLIPKEVADVEG